MRTRAIKFAFSILLARAAFGQAQSPSQVFHFTGTPSQLVIQQITNAIRTVGEISQARPDNDAKTLTVSGTPAQLAMAAWIFTAMDRPAPGNQATQEYRPDRSVNDVVRILYLAHPGTAQSFQEIVNAVRVIPEMARLFPYSAQNAVVMRGTDNQAAMTEWLFHQLDVPTGVQPVQTQDLAGHRYVPPGVANDELRVLFLTHEWNVPGMQQIVNAMRVIPQLTKVFPCTATGAVAVRGMPTTLALATWLLHQLDQAPPAVPPAPQEFRMPGGVDEVTQVFYLGAATTAEKLQGIVEAVRPMMNGHAFPNAMLNAVTLRGTASQIAAADALIKQLNQP